MPVYVINLDREPEKFRAISGRLSELGITFERVQAVDGALLPLVSNYTEELSPGEIGCYLSHKSVWESMLKSHVGSAIVLEDDAIIHDDFPIVAEALSKFETPHNVIIKLYHNKFIFNTSVTVHKLCPGYKIKIPDLIPWYTVGYFINQSAAHQLLNSRANFSRPIDDDMRHWWETLVHVLVVSPEPLGHNSQNSSISEGRDLARNLDFERARERKYRKQNLNYLKERIDPWLKFSSVYVTTIRFVQLSLTFKRALVQAVKIRNTNDVNRFITKVVTRIAR